MDTGTDNNVVSSLLVSSLLFFWSPCLAQRAAWLLVQEQTEWTVLDTITPRLR